MSYQNLQRNHEACSLNKEDGREVGLLSDSPKRERSGTFWLDTFEDETSACYFTTMEIAEDAMDAMEAGWNDLWSIDVGQYIGK